MGYRIAADLVVWAHLVFIAFVLAGGWLVAWRPWIAFVHVPAIAWAFLVEWNRWVCPLTPWELALRERAGVAGYHGGFVEHYLLPMLYPHELTAATQTLLAWVVVALNVAAYAWVWHRRRRGKVAARTADQALES